MIGQRRLQPCARCHSVCSPPETPFRLLETEPVQVEAASAHPAEQTVLTQSWSRTIRIPEEVVHERGRPPIIG